MEKKTSSSSFIVCAEVCWDCSNFGKSQCFNRRICCSCYTRGRTETPYLRGRVFQQSYLCADTHTLFPPEKKNSLFHLHRSEEKDSFLLDTGKKSGRTMSGRASEALLRNSNLGRWKSLSGWQIGVTAGHLVCV